MSIATSAAFSGVGCRPRESAICARLRPASVGSNSQRAITTFNRNWTNRMGFGGEGYLASPAVVAASALVGYMAPPSELGLSWDADKFGV